MLGRLAGVAAIVVAHAAPAADDLVPCEQVEARWRQATADTSLPEWDALYQQAYLESDCGSDVYAAIGLDIIGKELGAIARAYAAEAAAPREAGLRALFERIEQLRLYGSHWRLSFLQGEVLRRLKDPVLALQAYQESLGLVDDDELTPTPPPATAIARLRDRLDEAAVIVAQLRPAAARLPVNRHGQLISQYRFQTRGFVRQKVPVPIQFVFGEAEMTEEGRKTFDELLATLEDQDSPAILLVGHTDPVGSNADNLRLSVRRAEAVEQALLAGNYAGAVTTLGMGEEQPFRFDDPGLYSEAQRHQADRRVEIIRAPGGDP